VFLSLTSVAYAEGVDYVKVKAIQSAFASREPEVIADVCRFPIGRRYPVPWIANRKNLLARFDEVFDKELLDFIARSDPEKDWIDMGWQGVMLARGTLFLEDYKVYAVNYETAKEEVVRRRLIDADKRSLPASLRDFDIPVLKWTTKAHIVRVDQKDKDYRLVLFRTGRLSSPEIVLHGGKREFQRSIGTYLITWQTDNGTYQVDTDFTRGSGGHLETPAGTEYPEWN
jgi:hypothetical protein